MKEEVDMIKGVIFDMDGVMIDTELQSNLGWLWAANKEGVSMPMWLIDSFKGAMPQNSAKMFDDYYKGTKDYWKLRQLRSDHVHEIRKTESVPVKPGLINLLNFIKENNLSCAVATSTQRSSAEKSLHVIGAWDYLDAVVYGDEVLKGKPEPDIFLKAAKDINCEPEECIVIEDSINGIKAGYAARMKVVHVPDTISIDDDIKKMTSVICKDLNQVIEVIKSYNQGKEVENYTDTDMKLLFVDRVNVKNVFEAYTEKYNVKDPKIKLKVDHTYRVANLCERICKAHGISAYDTEIIWLSGMLHDIGRFEQIRQYKTFNDAVSVNHAMLSADLLFVEGLIKKFLPELPKGIDYVGNTLDEEKKNKNDLEILDYSIRVHNRYRIPENMTKREEAFSNILRDADKIDILRVNYETGVEKIYDVTTAELVNACVTDEVMEDFRREHSVLRSLKRTPVDHIVGHISLIFELIYEESIRAVVEQGYLDKLLNFESENPKTVEAFKEIKEIMNAYIEKRLKKEN